MYTIWVLLSLYPSSIYDNMAEIKVIKRAELEPQKLSSEEREAALMDVSRDIGLAPHHVRNFLSMERAQIIQNKYETKPEILPLLVHSICKYSNIIPVISLPVIHSIADVRQEFGIREEFTGGKPASSSKPKTSKPIKAKTSKPSKPKPSKAKTEKPKTEKPKTEKPTTKPNTTKQLSDFSVVTQFESPVYALDVRDVGRVLQVDAQSDYE